MTAKKIDKSGILSDINPDVDNNGIRLDAKRPLTVIELKDALKDLPDDMEVCVGGVGSAWITGYYLGSQFNLLREV